MKALQQQDGLCSDLVRKLDQLQLPEGSVLNVNVPNCSYDDIKGIKVTRLGHRERPDAPSESG